MTELSLSLTDPSESKAPTKPGYTTVMPSLPLPLLGDSVVGERDHLAWLRLLLQVGKSSTLRAAFPSGRLH